MRLSVAITGAATLGSSMVAAQAAPEANAIGIPAPEDLVNLVGRATAFDACHKVDTAADGLIWPCASALRTRGTLCPKNPATPEERQAQRDCLCGEPSSFLADSAACSECKHQNALQPRSEQKYWETYYKAVKTGYCEAKNETRGYEKFTADLDKEMVKPIAGGHVNEHPFKVIDPKFYYNVKDFGGVPKKQGAGKFTPAAPAKGEDANKNGTAVEDPAGQVKVPVYVVIEKPANDAKTDNPTARPPFHNGTTTVRTSTTPIVSLKPSTLSTVTTVSSSISSVITATPIVPAPGTPEEGVMVDGKLCYVIIVWVVIDCSSKKDATGNFAIGFENMGVDKKEPVFIVGNNTQFDQIKDSVPDAGKDVNLADEVKQIVGSEQQPVVVVTRPGNNENMPPAKKDDAKVPSNNKNNGNSGAQPVQDGEECVEEVDAPGATQIVPGGNSKPSASATQKNPNGSSSATGTPAQNGGKSPSQEGAKSPSQEGTKSPSQNGSKSPAQNGSKSPAQEGTKSPSQEGTKSPSQDGAKSPSQDGAKSPAQDGSKSPSQDCDSSLVPGKPADKPATETCVCPPAAAATASATPRPDFKEICDKKIKTETDCVALKDDAAVQRCLCSGAGFEDRRFFDEAIICARRSVPSVAQAEFEAQMLFEVKFRYCEKKLFPKFGQAYENVNNEWREARQPRADLS